MKAQIFNQTPLPHAKIIDLNKVNFEEDLNQKTRNPFAQMVNNSTLVAGTFYNLRKKIRSSPVARTNIRGSRKFILTYGWQR
uniref:Uncharacterized protein n=1 Tax=Romanomermis culicivorax TaxID=13658 RepID=A0A915KG72_ROMCU